MTATRLELPKEVPTYAIINFIFSLRMKTYIHPYHGSSFPIFHGIGLSYGCSQHADKNARVNYSKVHVINTIYVFLLPKPTPKYNCKQYNSVYLFLL